MEEKNKTEESTEEEKEKVFCFLKLLCFTDGAISPSKMRCRKSHFTQWVLQNDDDYNGNGFPQRHIKRLKIRTLSVIEIKFGSLAL